MTLLVLALAAVNVASLLLVRSAGRVREFSLRYAIGANNAQITAQLLLEGLLLGLLGGLAGLALAPVAPPCHAPAAGRRRDQPRLRRHPGQLACSSSGCSSPSVVSVLFSLAPVVQLRRTGSRRCTAPVCRHRPLPCAHAAPRCRCPADGPLRSATASAPASSSGSMQALRAVDVGFNTSHLVTFATNPRLAGIPAAAVPALEQRLLDTLAALPGVDLRRRQQRRAARRRRPRRQHHPSPATPRRPTTRPTSRKEFISPAYFETLRVPLLAAGRDLHPRR